MKTVKEVSKQTGVSVRTLHHYDAIGLLKPTKVTSAGYRLYDDNSLVRLQNILMFRELQFPLREIKKILDSPMFNQAKALEEQIQLLELQKKHIEALISYAREIRDKGVLEMNFQVFDKTELEQYAAEAREKWGYSDAYREYEQKTKQKTEQELQETTQQFLRLFAEFGLLRFQNPTQKEVQEKVGDLQAFITQHYYLCTNEILKGLGQMYVQDERMKKNINEAGGEGTAEFISQAISIYCSEQSVS